MAARITSVLVLFVALTACSETPTQPTYNKPVPPILFHPICVPMQTEIHCTLKFLQPLQWVQGAYRDVTQDVTVTAGWSVSSEPDMQADTDVAIVARPGVVVPLRKGNIYIRAAYDRLNMHAGHSFALDPGSRAIPMAPYLNGVVAEAGGSPGALQGPRIAGALVEILEPMSEVDKSYVTDTLGLYRFKHLPIGVPITVRASKAGYISSTKANAGITVDSEGTPRNYRLDFELERVQ